MFDRGRLNVLGNVFRKTLSQIFSEFDKNAKPVEEVGFTRVLVTLSIPVNLGKFRNVACFQQLESIIDSNVGGDSGEYKAEIILLNTSKSTLQEPLISALDVIITPSSYF